VLETTADYTDEKGFYAKRDVTTNCLFCRIVSGELPATVVYEDENSVAFLDHRPLFPRSYATRTASQHVETLGDLRNKTCRPLTSKRRNCLLARAVEAAMEAEGTFVAMNNRVSQSVPHLHVHIVPRRRKDGLKGFFWPRTKYKSDEEMKEVQSKITAALKKFKIEKLIFRFD
jgi:histidine triad (HIT) family protein